MAQLVEFGRVFLSYGVVVVIIAAVGAVAYVIGTSMAKKKNHKNQK